MEELESVGLGLLSLPNEEILQICSNLNDTDLNRFMQTYKNVEAVCRGELERRKQGPSKGKYNKYQANQKVLDIVRKTLQQSSDPDVIGIKITIETYKSIIVTYNFVRYYHITTIYDNEVEDDSNYPNIETTLNSLSKHSTGR